MRDRRLRLRPLAFAVLFAAGLAVAGIQARADQAAPVPGTCITWTLLSGAQSMVCIPASGWNGGAIVFAHGYVAPFLPRGFYNLNLPDGTYVPDLVQGLGFAFATTSYRRNGLAILEGVADIEELAATLPANTRTWLAGVSEGGLVTALAAERPASPFVGGYELCGPVGDFRRQIDYFGDFRVLFDYFYPGVIRGSAISIPPDVIAAWQSYYVPYISQRIAADPALAKRFLTTARAPYDPADPRTLVQTTIDVLTYNIYATNDAAAQLGGNPYGNRYKWYSGSGNDLRLNLKVARYAASPAALTALRPYITTGNPTIPVVGLHTTGDDVVPFGQELLYWGKVTFGGSGRFTPLPVFRYGHCNFTKEELVAGLQLLLKQQ